MRLYQYVFTILSFIVCQPVFSAPIATTSESYYSIYGENAAELRAEMRRKGPLDNGKRYDAFTRYYVHWKYDYQEDNIGCALKNIRVTVDTKYVYPKWVNYESGSAETRRGWDRYYARLKEHESGHGMNGRNAANEIDMMLSQMPAMANCKQLGTVANQKAYSILSKYQHADVEFDRETNHGIAQGVVLSE